MTATTGAIESRGARRLRGLGVLASLALVAVAWHGGEQWSARQEARASFPTASGTLSLPGLSGPVEVLRDERGVPHIEARSDRDAWTALGFVHAQDRLAQMLWLRRLARGRTAEIVGRRGLSADRLARTLGVGRLADAEVERLDADTRAVLDAYASGVNARISRIEAGVVAAPLGIAPAPGPLEPWTPGDSLAVVKLIAWSAGPAPETAVVLWDLVDRLGSAAAMPFVPTGMGVKGAGIAVALPEPGLSGADTGPHTRSSYAGGRDPLAGLISGSTRGTSLADALLSSSAWVVSGRLSDSGAPLLAVDFHLAPTVPSLVYEAQLRGNRDLVAGATVPGVPVFWAGRNRDVAWAATPARVVTSDVYEETINPENPDEFRYGRRWEKIVERVEEITVVGRNGVIERESLRIRETRHGPIVNDLIGRKGEPLALRWTGALEGDGVTAMLGVARASTGDEVVQALAAHHEPVLAMVYADREGAAGVRVAGSIQRRRLPTGLVPVPGRQRIFDWRDKLAPDSLPSQVLTDETDWLIAADNPLTDDLGGRIEWLWRTGERAARLDAMLRELVEDRGQVDLRSLAALRPEMRALVSPEFVPSLLDLAGDRSALSPEAREVADLLRQWDGTIRPRSRGAAALHLVLHHLTRELFAGPVGPERLRHYLALPHNRPEVVTEQVVLAAAKYAPKDGWAEPERVRVAIRTSLRAAWMSLSLKLGPNRSRWQWGRLNGMAFRPFATASERGRTPRGALAELAELGGGGAVSDTNPADPYEVRAASTYRLVIDLAAPDHMLSSLAPGQSEHPFHRHFDDGVRGWVEGRQRLLAMSRFMVEEARADRLVLEPAP